MIVVLLALIVPSNSTTTITTNTTQIYSVHRKEHLVQQVTKYLQGGREVTLNPDNIFLLYLQ
jgi:hypothetical protein